MTNGQRGPQVAPFIADRDEALSSLARIENLDAKHVLPGHGPVWSHGIGAAVGQVRQANTISSPR